VIGGLGLWRQACAAAVVAPRLLAKRYGTAVGEIRRVPMSDGSMAAINTRFRTRSEHAASPARSEAGQVARPGSPVAKDPSRPFVVESGPVRVRAVGTAFLGAQARRRAATSWSPRVWSRCGPRTWSPPRRVFAGERMFASDEAGVLIAP
jgi:transmembrane sensor